MMTLALVAGAFFVVAALVAIVRLATNRAPASGDLNSMTVSRQWLTQHQSNDHV